MLASPTLRQVFDQRVRQGAPLNVLEKDYAVSYVLAGIAAVPELYEIAVFKGGTSLRKAYFEGYRFSVDLDYTVLRRLPCDELQKLIEKAVRHAEGLLQQRGPFELTLRSVAHGEVHENGQCEFKIAVKYPWMRGVANCVLKIELLPAPPEVIVGKPEERKLMHVGYNETLTANMMCYELREIASEKLRGFLQTRARFKGLERGERTFVRTRPRDLFDLAHLYRQPTYDIDWTSVRGFLERKADAYGLKVSGPADLLDERVLEGMKRTWDGQLRDFIVPLASFDECLGAHKELLAKVFA